MAGGKEALEQYSNLRRRRRAVVAGLAAALAPMPLAAQGQQRDGMRRLGVLIGTANDPEGQARATALTKELATLGWYEGRNLRIDWRWADGDPALFERYGTELVALGPDVLVATGDTSVEAMRRQTRTIPIVFVLVGDPVGGGFVESLAHPAGTVTGFTTFDPPMAGKWLQMLTQIAPPVARVAVLYNPATAPYPGRIMRVIEEAAQSLAVMVQAAPVHDDAEIQAVMAGLARDERCGLLVLSDGFNTAHHEAIVTFAAEHRLPVVYPYRFFVTTGGLMSYGIDGNALYRRSADYIDRILKGAKTGDLPVQNPTKFELVLNLKTAKALGVTFPTTLLATADEVID
jgi:putative ABC transport system substrate-binding protein